MYRSKFRHDFKLNGHAGSSSRKLHDRNSKAESAGSRSRAHFVIILFFDFAMIQYTSINYNVYCFTKRPNKGILEYGIYNQNLSQTRAWCFHGENINMLRALHSHITMVFDTL